MPNAHDVEDWLNLENELQTSLQMSDVEIIATVVGDSMKSESVCSDEGKDEKCCFPLAEVRNILSHTSRSLGATTLDKTAETFQYNAPWYHCVQKKQIRPLPTPGAMLFVLLQTTLQ